MRVLFRLDAAIQTWLWTIFFALALAGAAPAQQLNSLVGTQSLTSTGDLSAQMVAGISKFLDSQTEQSVRDRSKYWHRGFSAPDAYELSIETNRNHLRTIIGAVEPRAAVGWLDLLQQTTNQALIGETDLLTIRTLRWPVCDAVAGEGLWLQPKGPVLARVIVIPDADQTPELLTGLAPGLAPERQFARRLAEQGCEVLVPVLVNREDTFSGSARLNRFTNQPHREWIYRQAYELGRHVIGYEVEKVLAAVDFFVYENRSLPSAPARIGMAGYGEGGLLGLYAAALDKRVSAALISGYFDSRQSVWQEPIYRNVFGLLREFGDAELATMIAPRALILEHSAVPSINGPPAPRAGHSGAAPGKLVTPDYVSVESEFERARSLLGPASERFTKTWNLICGTEGRTTGPFSDRASVAFLKALGISREQLKPAGKLPSEGRPAFDAAARQERQVKELEEHTQKLLRNCAQVRDEFFWKKIKADSPQDWQAATPNFRQIFREEVIGAFSCPALSPNPQARKILDRPKWTAFEVVLDVYPDVFAWGYLLVPKDLKDGERRPVVVCQHGLEGVPADVINEDTQSRGYGYYKAFAARLAERGFVVFAPHNPYRGGDRFRELQRKANPLGKSLFSVIIAQHSRIIEWLGQLPFVDPKRIGFYGLSYGGKTAMRVPAALDGYCLSICSGDFNDWVRKNASTEDEISYMFMGEYEMPEWNLGQTFNYAEMAALIAPRPFMVERGHNDGVGLDEWVAYEYDKVRRLYEQLGIPDHTAIEFFDGPHTINGVGTFKFLEKHLRPDSN